MKPIDFTKLKISTLLLVTALVTGVVIVLTRTEAFDLLSRGIAPVASAFVLAYFLDYIVRGIQKYIRIPRWAAILLTLVLLCILVILAGYFIIPSGISAGASFLQSLSKVNIDLDAILRLKILPEEFDHLREQLARAILPTIQKLTELTGTTLNTFFREIGRLTSSLISAFITLSIALYIIGEKSDLSARFNRLLHAYLSERSVSRLHYIASLSDRIFRGFVVGKVIDSIIIGFICYFVLTVFQFKYAILIATVVGITNIIPYFGPIIGAVPAALITLVANYNDPIQVLYILLIILAIQQLDGIVIGPMILGDSVGVSPFWIILSVTVGGAMFGFIGMFLSVPTVVLVKTLIEDDVQNKLKARGIENLDVDRISKKGKL